MKMMIKPTKITGRSSDNYAEREWRKVYATPAPLKWLTEEEYADVLCDCVSILPTNMIIHRLTGDAPKKLLVEPKWSADKKAVLNLITKTFNERNVLQGSNI